MPRVLIVEDRGHCRLAPALRDAGIEVEVTQPVAELLVKAIDAVHPNVVVLEVTGIAHDVETLCRLAVQSSSAPVVVFAERRSEREYVDAYEAGVHMIFGEPIGDHELVARVRAVLRRSPSVAEDTPDVLVVGPIVLDRGRHQVAINGDAVPLPRKEFEIAEMLMRHAGLVVTRRDLIRELWGAPRDTKSLDVQVGRLRNRLATIEGVQRIVTVRGVGYRMLIEPLTEAMTSGPTLTSQV